MKIKIKKKYLIISVFLVLAIAVAASMLMGGRNLPNDNTTRVKLGNIQDTLDETGTVFSKRVNTFYSDISQRVKILNVSIGDTVKKGDVILTYENNYSLEIERAKKQIEAITASYNETVKKVDFQEVSNMKLNISTLENNVSLEKNNLEKLKVLYENNAVSEIEYKEAENDVLAIENQLLEAKNNYELLMKGVSSNVKKQYEAQIEEIMIQIKILEQNIKSSSIIAEFDGLVTELNVHQGGMTRTGVPVVEIQDPNSIGVYVEVLAEDAVRIVNNMPFIINKEKEAKSLKVNRIYPKAEATVSELGVEQKRVRVEADLPEDLKLKIGSEVDVVIILEEKSNVLLVDRDAVYDQNHKEFVTVIKGKEKTEKEVTTGLKDDTNVEIVYGLSENEVVIIEY